MDRSVFKLSGGEKQRVAFAGGLYARPAAVGAGRADEQPGRRRHRAAARYDRRDEAEGRDRCAGGAPPCLDHRFGRQVFLLCGGRLAAQWSAAEFAALPADTLAGYGLRARTLDDCRAGIRAKQSARCPGTPVLTLEGVTLGCDKKHPLRTLPDMSFAAGEIVGLMGRNGIGKSTMARTLCGLLEPVSGKNLPERQTRHRQGSGSGAASLSCRM